MSLKCWVSKGDMLTMLGDDAFNFCAFLCSDDQTAKVINKMFEITPSSGVELDEPLVQGMLTTLANASVISQGTIDRINNWITVQTSGVTYAEKTYSLQKYINGSEYDISWINQNAIPQGVTVVIAEKEINYEPFYEITLNGTLPPPAVEVID